MRRSPVQLAYYASRAAKLRASLSSSSPARLAVGNTSLQDGLTGVQSVWHLHHASAVFQPSNNHQGLLPSFHLRPWHSAPRCCSNAQPELALVEEEQDAAQESKQSITEDARQDEFLQSITAGDGPLALYKQNRLAGRYRRDPRQEAAISALQELYEQLSRVLKPRRPSGLTLVDHVGDTHKRKHWWESLGLLGKEPKQAAANMPRGLYLYGGVGTGKTMLMDLLVNSAPPHFKLRRATFHDFMLDVHGRLHRSERVADPLTAVAAQIAAETSVLALDEFFVTDVADATMLSRLFSALWARGLVLVATSNRAPDALYENGLQRDLFLPFIARLQQATRVLDIASGTDYRQLAQHRRGLFYAPADFADPDAEADAQFGALAAACHEPVQDASVEVAMGRHLSVPAASGGICMFPFEELCGRPVAAADYIGLCKIFHTLVLKGVPIFNAANRNEAYRFLTLVDILYDHNIRLFCSAQGTPFQLFEHIVTRGQSRPHLSSQSGSSDEDIIDDNLGFSKERCISRLVEMQSLEYLIRHAKRHSPSLLLALEEAQQRTAGGD